MIRTAREIYEDCACDPEMAAAVRREKAALGLKITQGQGGQISSATVNGQSFAIGKDPMTNYQRYIMLGWVIKQLKHGGHISTTQISTF